MKTRLTVFALLALITLVVCLLAPTSLAQTNKPINKKEVKVLLKTAQSPSDHRKIAEYYRQEAQRLTARSKNHGSEVGPLTQSGTFAAMDSKHPGAYGPTPSHCNYWSKQYAAEAEKATKLATTHEQMAQKAETQSASLISRPAGQ